jgi:hypothetical protein
VPLDPSVTGDTPNEVGAPVWPSSETGSSAPLVSFVIVSWNCRSFLGECLRSIREHVHVEAILSREVEVVVLWHLATPFSACLKRNESPLRRCQLAVFGHDRRGQ